MKYLKTYEQNNDEFKNFLRFLNNFINEILNKYNFSISGNYVSYKKGWGNKDYIFTYNKSVYFTYSIFYISINNKYFNISLNIKHKGEGIPESLKKCLYFIEDSFKLYGGNINISEIEILKDHLTLEQFEIYDKIKKYNL